MTVKNVVQPDKDEYKEEVESIDEESQNHHRYC